MSMGINTLNWACFAIGIVAVWYLSQDWLIVFFAWVASLHFNVRVKVSP